MRMQDMTAAKLLSIAVILLILSLPLASATEIRLFFGPDERAFPFTGREFVTKEIEVRNGRVFLNITPGRGHSLRRVLLFPCRGLGPLECMGEKPIEYEGYSRTYLLLEDLLENGRGGILTLAMLNTTSWIGFWDSYEDGAFTGRDMDSLGLNINVDTGEAEGQISEYGMVPVNWVDEADFSGKELYQAEAERMITEYGENLNFTRLLKSRDLIDTRDYLFVFPASGRVYNPLTFYYQPPVECGNYLCELGESQGTCCRDCGCPENQSCSRQGCIPASDIKLVLDSMNPSPPMECYIQNSSCVFQKLLELGLHIENPPQDYWLNDYFFSFGGRDYREMACLPENGTLDCTLLLPRLNRSRGFQEMKVLSLYLSIGYMELGKTRTLEIPLDIDLDIKGTSLEEELDLQSLRDKLAQMAKTMEKIDAILKFVKMLMNIYYAYQAWNFMQAATHKALAAVYMVELDEAVACCVACEGTCGCCEAIPVLEELISLELKLEMSFFARGAHFLWMMLKAQIIVAIINALINEWAKYKMGQLEDRLKQKIERIGRDTMSIVGDEVSGTLPLLVWAKGSYSGDYTKGVCNGEDVEIRYDFTTLNCSGSLWLTPEGFGRHRANATGEHLLLGIRADQLFPIGRDSMAMGVECNSTRYYNPVSDTTPFLNYTQSCTGVAEPRIEMIRPANGTAQAGRDMKLAYSVTHPLHISSCDTFVNGNLVQSRRGPESGREQELELLDLITGVYRWRVECEDILGARGSTQEWEFRIGGTA